MCFGNQQTSSQNTSRTTPQWLSGAAQNNVNFATNIGSGGYVGQQVAGLTPDQTSSFGQVRNIAGSGNPYLSQIQNAYTQYGSTPAQSVNAPSVLGAGTNAATASLTDYLDPSIKTELAPQLAEIERQRQIAVSGAGGVGSQATAHGGGDAFGDARAGIAEAGTNAAAMRQSAQATGQAYSQAFQNAMNLRGIDVNNLLNQQTTNAGLNEQALSRLVGSGNALSRLDQSQLNRGLTAANALGAAGLQQQQQNQAQANLPWLNNQGGLQWDLSRLAGMNQATSAATPAAGYNQTTTSYAPEQQRLGARRVAARRHRRECGAAGDRRRHRQWSRRHGRRRDGLLQRHHGRHQPDGFCLRRRNLLRSRTCLTIFHRSSARAPSRSTRARSADGAGPDAGPAGRRRRSQRRRADDAARRARRGPQIGRAELEQAAARRHGGKRRLGAVQGTDQGEREALKLQADALDRAIKARQVGDTAAYRQAYLDLDAAARIDTPVTVATIRAGTPTRKPTRIDDTADLIERRLQHAIAAGQIGATDQVAHDAFRQEQQRRLRGAGQPAQPAQLH